MRVPFLLALALLAAAPRAGAGTVSSGGGRLFKFSENPWFLENTTEVRYCLEVDEAAFGVSYWTLAARIDEAFGEWQTLFARTEDNAYDADDPLVPFGQLRLGTQRFVREACSDQTDLRFQFGVLHDDQRQHFETVNDFVGAAVRTEYDLEQLRSKGFVYLAPPRGPLKPDAPDVHPDVWSVGDGLALRLVLWHELGHVFGMPHGQDFAAGIMNERLPEAVIHGPTLTVMAAEPAMAKAALERWRPLNTFTANDTMTLEGCGDEAPVGPYERAMLALPAAHACIRVAFDSRGATVSSAPAAGEAFETSGRIQWDAGQGSSGRTLATVVLPSEQKVFTRIPDLGPYHPYMTLSGEDADFEQWRSGAFTAQETGATMPVAATFKALGELDVIGINGGRIRRGLVRGP